MMRWRRMAAIALRYFYLLGGSPARVVPLFAWVGIDIVLWGFISRYLNSVASHLGIFRPALLGNFQSALLGNSQTGVDTWCCRNTSKHPSTATQEGR
jgi:hypothetical protein